MADELPQFDKLWNFGDPAGTEKKFREILPRAVAAENLDYELELRTQIARTLGLQRKFAEAHAELDGVKERLPQAAPRTVVRYLLERGRALNSSGKPQESVGPFKEAWDRAKKAKEHSLAVDAAHMLGIAADAKTKESWTRQAIVYAEECGDEKAARWLGTLYNNLGWNLFDAKRYEDSLAVHKKGLAWQLAHKRDGLIAEWSVAKLERMCRRPAEALALQRAVLARREKLEKPETGFVSEEIGECLLALGKDDEARPWFKTAHEKLSKIGWVARSDPDRIARLARLAGNKK